MTILEALEFIEKEMDRTYEDAFKKSKRSPTKIPALAFNNHRRDLRAIAERLRRTGGDANQSLT